MKKLKIWHDSNAECPFETWDSEPELMYWGSRNNGVTDYSKGKILSFIRNKATTSIIIRHQKRLAEILDVNLQYFKQYSFTSEEKADDIRSAMDEVDLSELASVCLLLKIPHLQYDSKGCSQGDSADVLIVLTDEFFETTGCERKNSEIILKDTATLFDNWAWGNTFGFSVVEITTCNLGCEHEEIVDSCGGFYGDNFMTNGMADHIEEELHEQLANYDYDDIKY